MIITFVFGGVAFGALFLASAMLVVETALGHRLLLQDIARSRAAVFVVKREQAQRDGGTSVSRGPVP